ncbi:hypothetical protein Peur_047709 [Populus x canadensis]
MFFHLLLPLRAPHVCCCYPLLCSVFLSYCFTVANCALKLLFSSAPLACLAVLIAIAFVFLGAGTLRTFYSRLLRSDHLCWVNKGELLPSLTERKATERWWSLDKKKELGI